MSDAEHPVLDDAFGHWFAGFTDGEGCFRVKPTNQGTYQCRFSIGLRADDAPILREIHRRLGVGSLCHSGKTNIHQEQWRLEVNSKADVTRLVEVFDKYQLRAKKAADFAIWREAVFVWNRVANGKRHDWTDMAVLADALREERRYVPLGGRGEGSPRRPCDDRRHPALDVPPPDAGRSA